MGALARFDNWLARAFNPGAVAVDQSSRYFGVDSEQWSPQEYGQYIATSNAVYTVVKKRATYLSSLPFVLARLKADGEANPVTKGAAWELTHKVNPYWTWRRLVEMTEMSLCLWGVAFWFLERGGNGGIPRELYWARPDRVKVIPHPTRYVDRFEYHPSSGQEPIRFKPSEAIWLRYPNPLDEYSGLSPLAAARLAADTQGAAMKQNYSLFKNGVSIGGLVTPNNGHMQPEAAREIKEQLQHRAKGVANAHRWLVLLHDAKFQPMTLSPRDAEFVGLHRLTLEDICRPYGVPLDLVGGQRTYANYEEAVKAMWTETIIPEGGFIADEITEQLLPMFTGSERVDVVEFDHSGVEVLQQDEEARWRIAEGKLRAGVLTQNEYRSEHKQDPVPWGEKVWWGSVALVPIESAELPEPGSVPEALETQGGPQSDEEDDDNEESPGADAERLAAGQKRTHTRITYGSDEHRRIFRQFVARTERHEEAVSRASKRLFRQQEQSILTELGKVRRAAEPDDLDVEVLLAKIVNLARWKKRFRAAIHPVLGRIVASGGQEAMDTIALGVGFDVSDPLVARFLERRAQRFAVEVNQTTWDLLKASLIEGLEDGEGTDVLAQRVRAVMGGRIRSSEEVIARTEVISAYNGGALEGARQSGQVETKEWLASLDDRTRETHVAAHGQVVALDANFTVGGASGPAPGQINRASESIQCRCSMLFGLKPLGE